MLWIVVHEPFRLKIHCLHCLRNITRYCFVNLRCQYAARKDGHGNFRLGIEQTGSLRRAAEVKIQRATKGGVDMTFGVIRRKQAAPVAARGKMQSRFREEAQESHVRESAGQHSQYREDLGDLQKKS